MSFKLLKKEIIDVGLCQGCGMCAGSCKHIVMDKLRPKLKDYCILERNGEDCGKCYRSCPQVIQKAFENQQPKALYSLRTKNKEILKRSASGGFVTTIAKYLLETKELEEVIMVQNANDVPKAEITDSPQEVVEKAGVVYGRSGVLEKLVKSLGDTYEPVGIVGVACEMRGAAELEETMKRDVLKIGLFCNSAIRTELTDQGKVCSPCCNGCPAGVNAQSYISHIRNGNYQEAVDIIRDKNPLPSICGRICTHECEHGCTLIGTDHPVAVRELKKFVTEWEMKNAEKAPDFRKNPDGKKVAIIGSGPAGLTASYYLAKMGYNPTIFEKTDKTGGMLRFGVPQFRLPNYVLDYDIQMIQKAGVEIKTNSPLGPNMTINDLKDQGYEAIFIATGQYKPRTLHLEGEDLPGVYVAINFLIDRKYRYWENQEEFKGKSVGIIGGGPVAVDVAQTALRLGAEKVHLVDIASEKDLELVLRDIPEDEYEHMQYHFESSTSKITQNDEGKLVLNTYEIEWGEPDEETGRKPLNKIEGTDSEIPVDAIVIAVGQAVDFEEIEDASTYELKKERNKIKINELTFETSIPSVFAGGDIVANSKAVAIAAIAHGREAAISIDRYLKGEDLAKGRFKQTKSFFSGPKRPPKDYSKKPESLEDATEDWSFVDEIDGMFNEDMAVKEARRCLSCNHFCAHCQDFPAIYSDFTAGEVGSQPGYTTVVVWSDRGKEIVEKAISEGLFEQGEVDRKALEDAIILKSKRDLLKFKKTPEDMILDYIDIQGPSTISKLSEYLSLESKKVRNEALRLVRKNKLLMKIEPSLNEPIFSKAST